MADDKPEFHTQVYLDAQTKAGTTAQPTPTPTDQSGAIPVSDYLRLLAATGLRVGGPMIGQAAGALIPLPGTAEAGGAIGGGLGETLAEQIEPGSHLGSKPNLGRVAVASGLGAVPGSWISSVKPLASAIKGGALSYAGIAGNKIADKGISTEAVNPVQWSGEDLTGLGLGTALGSYFGSRGEKPSNSVPPPTPAPDPLTTHSGLRVAAQNLAKTKVGTTVTPDTIAAQNAIADHLEASPTGTLAQDIYGAKGVPPKPSISEMDVLHQDANNLTSKMTPEQKAAYANSKMEQGMLAKAQKYAEKVQADKAKAQLSSGTEQARALDKAGKAQIQEGAEQTRAIDKQVKADDNLSKAQGQAIEENKIVDLKRQAADEKAKQAIENQKAIDLQKEGTVPTASPVKTTIKNGNEGFTITHAPEEPSTPDTEGNEPVADQGPVAPPTLPHEQNFFTKSDALKAAKAANASATKTGQPVTYDPGAWDIRENPQGGFRIVQKDTARTAASPALTQALATEEGAANPTASTPTEPTSSPLDDPEAFAKLSPEEQQAAIAQARAAIEPVPGAVNRPPVKPNLGSEAGGIDPLLATRLGLGAGGALLGAAASPDDRMKGAIVGGSIGAGLPSGAKAIGKINWGALGKKLPDIERFGYLANPNSMSANMLGAPAGLGATTAAENWLQGLIQRDPAAREKAIALFKSLPSLPKRWGKAMGEAGDMMIDSPENIGEMDPVKGRPTTAKGWANWVLAKPAQGITGAHIALRDAAIDAGYPKAQATEYALGNDPGIGSGNKTIRAFGKGLQNMKATKLEDGTSNPLGNMVAPFTRTATNVLAATPTRTPIIGALLKAAGGTEESWGAIAAQQGVGTALSGLAYVAGENTDPETAKILRKWVRNMGGRYGLVTTIAFEMGQAARQGKPMGKAVISGAVNGVPMPTSEPFQDIANALVSTAGGQPMFPGAFIPGSVKDQIPKEFVTSGKR